MRWQVQSKEELKSGSKPNPRVFKQLSVDKDEQGSQYYIFQGRFVEHFIQFSLHPDDTKFKVITH